MIQTFMKPLPVFTVVIDAGHGGPDPGKVGINDILEKDINLQISLLLSSYLKQNDVRVIMTREEDTSLSTSTSHAKLSDLQNRKEIMESCHADAVISIHQNSFPSQSVHGAQVFYGTNNPSGKQLAVLLQSRLLKADPSNTRSPKENGDYYLFRNTSLPIVIVECGFLSNPTEASLLADPAYQKKLAWQLHLGILEYLRKQI